MKTPTLSQIEQSLRTLDFRLKPRVNVPEIETLLNRTVLWGGKRLRPTLCFLMGQVFGVEERIMAPYARAVEFVHAATLSHDDVIDQASKRRNRPSINATSTNTRAVLAGDLLLSQVMVEVSGLGRINVVQDLARVMRDLVDGEWLQYEAKGVIDVDRRHLEEVARLKTGSLMGWCTMVPARITGQEDQRVQLCRDFGETLGIAFQMIDDVIDFEPSSEKVFAQDVRVGLMNSVTVEMMEMRAGVLNGYSDVFGLGDQLPEVPKWPWTHDELLTAMGRVRNRASAKLTVARSQIQEISKFVNQTPESLEAMDALYSVLDQLDSRKV